MQNKNYFLQNTLMFDFILLLMVLSLVACEKTDPPQAEPQNKTKACIIDGMEYYRMGNKDCNDYVINEKNYILESIINVGKCSETIVEREDWWIYDYTLTFFDYDTMIGDRAYNMRIQTVNNEMHAWYEESSNCKFSVPYAVTTDLPTDAYDDLVWECLHNENQYFGDSESNMYKYCNDSIILKFRSYE